VVPASPPIGFHVPGAWRVVAHLHFVMLAASQFGPFAAGISGARHRRRR
jgi:heme/copper-type cytochrome/quinol oxidase subunit 1